MKTVSFTTSVFFITSILIFTVGVLVGYSWHLLKTCRRMRNQIIVNEDIAADVQREDRWFEEMHARAHEKLRGHSETALQPEWMQNLSITLAHPSELETDEIPGYNVEPKPEFQSPFSETKKQDDGTAY